MPGDIRSLYDAGLTAVFSIVPGPMSLDYAMKHAKELIISLVANVVRLKLQFGPDAGRVRLSN